MIKAFVSIAFISTALSACMMPGPGGPLQTYSGSGSNVYLGPDGFRFYQINYDTTYVRGSYYRPTYYRYGYSRYGIYSPYYYPYHYPSRYHYPTRYTYVGMYPSPYYGNYYYSLDPYSYGWDSYRNWAGYYPSW